MKTFLKVLLILLAAVVVIKLLPALLIIGGVSLGGLLLAGWMADRLGGLGPAMAVLAIGPLVRVRGEGRQVPQARFGLAEFPG